MGEDGIHIAALHGSAGVHDHDIIGRFCHHAHVMGNHDGGGAGFALGELNDVQNLRLNGHIQSGRGLIGDKHARIIGNCDGNDHALAHAARELVREGLQPQMRIGDAY